MNKAHRPCFVLAVDLALGIMAGKFLPVPLWVWLAIGMAGLVLFFVRRFTWLIYVLFFCLGAAWIQHRYLLPLQSIAFLSVEERQHLQETQGVVDSDVGRQGWARGEKTVFELNVRQILVDGRWRSSSGKVRVELYGDNAVHYGQALAVRGKIHPIFDGYVKKGFSYRRYLQDQGIYWTISVAKKGVCKVLSEGQGNITVAWAIQVRRWMIGIFYRYLAPREAGFTAALVLGDRTGMPKDLKQIFVNTGTAHILAISGMNMTIVAAIFLFILKLFPLPRWARFLGVVLFLFAYAFLSGWSASVVRSCIMSSVILAGFAFEQEGEALNSLGVAALILLLMDPHNLFDVGFQLSFAAVAAILILYPYCQKPFAFLPGFLRVSMAVSLAAWAGTAGFIFYHFHMITPISILANIPIVPLADLVMALGLGLTVAGCWAPVGLAFAGCLKAVLSAMVIFAAWFNQVPYGHFIF